MPQKRIPLARCGAVFALFVFLGWTIYTPIQFTLLKLVSLAGWALLFVALGAKTKHGKWLCLLILTALLVLRIWPARAPQPRALRTNYIAALRGYEGTPYVWGGENARGIDCSGLIRRAMFDALLTTGWQQHDPALWREAALLWWYDCSANEMKNGYRGRITSRFEARSLNTLESHQNDLQPGDLAVTQSGVHVLAYLNDNTWIQADPNLANGGDKVIQTRAPSRSGWFGQPMVICRWESLK